MNDCAQEIDLTDLLGATWICRPPTRSLESVMTLHDTIFRPAASRCAAIYVGCVGRGHRESIDDKRNSFPVNQCKGERAVT